ncbi:hypothetical protein GIB67_021476 [Kingdonia uniflora]|uniref:Uncharacterized protein n=1 Tax=Kingdonia uniflora TaxID=39325 RepID=A0A7J7L9E8_9MAGN|nr:hypothetical protein GIB67_021476 [Kingdonia uniflora]
MGGKGQRRREKNFNAAHGGYSRLPPPPKSDEVDVLPSKLRRLLEFTNSSSLNNNKASTTTPTDKRKNNNRTGGGDKKLNQKDELGATLSEETRNDIGGNARDETKDKKKKAKRKRKEISDLRFDAGKDEGKGVVGVKRRERQKKYLEVKRNRNKKPKIEEGITFQGHEEIKFGEVVQAPPKLLVVPKKVTKPVHDASRERLRVKTVEAYRNHKAWSSRPGIGVLSVTPSF